MKKSKYEAYKMNHLKGEALNVDFDGGIRLEFHGAKSNPVMRQRRLACISRP